MSDSFCDGLGSCLAVCPQGALKIEERDPAQFDECAARSHRQTTTVEPYHRQSGPAERYPADFLSPCTRPISLKESPEPCSPGKNDLQHDMTKKGEPGENELCGWPIQMNLVRPWAPYLKGARLLVAGDCTAFAYPAIQKDFIRGRVVLVGCPKLDDTGPFVEKLAEIPQAERDYGYSSAAHDCALLLTACNARLPSREAIWKRCARKEPCCGNRRNADWRKTLV